MLSMDGLLFSCSARPIVSCCAIHSQKRHILMVAAVVMILRVWAMYNRSRFILGTLLILFFVEIISTIFVAAINSNPENVSGV